MKFSIIVPVYNVVGELPRTMTSLLSQQFEDYEIILVDDGSTDGSGELCDASARQNARVKVIHQANSGVVAARKHGFEASSGSWVFFVDGDDALKLNTLVAVDFEIKRTDADIVMFGYTMIAGSRVEQNLPEPIGLFSTDELIFQMRKTPLEFVGMCIWNKCYRRECVAQVFADVGDVRISHSEDGLFAFAAFLHARTICILPECYYDYIVRAGSAVHRVNCGIVSDKEQFISRIQMLMERVCKIDDESLWRCVDFHCYEAACYIFLMLRRNRADWRTTIRVLKELNSSQFFRRENAEWSSLKRKGMRFLLAHPYLYCLLGPVIDFFYVKG